MQRATSNIASSKGATFFAVSTSPEKVSRRCFVRLSDLQYDWSFASLLLAACSDADGCRISKDRLPTRFVVDTPRSGDLSIVNGRHRHRDRVAVTRSVRPELIGGDR